MSFHLKGHWFTLPLRLWSFPGTKGRFEVLLDHAPLISSLEKGVIAYRNGEGTDKVAISSGFVEVNDNHVVACVEL